MTLSRGDGFTIPRGIEILVKKASVDPEFRRLLLERRAEAARQIGLELNAAEAAMLGAIPAEQLEAIIARAKVDPRHRAAFRGGNVAAMLIALGALGVVTAVLVPSPAGVSPEQRRRSKESYRSLPKAAPTTGTTAAPKAATQDNASSKGAGHDAERK